jgi:zinc transport system permease protein|tara:strand:+ start:1264 stop:1686 length:423 start_codon:yes stop_codon:yes gene_type:complete
LWRILILDAILLGLLGAYYPIWQASAFDEEFARLRGVKVELFSALFIALVSLSVVLLLSVVGLLLVVALMTLPASAASRVTKSLGGMMIGGVVICAISVVSGLALSYATDWPSGPSIVIFSAVMYFAFAQFGSWRSRRQA